VSNHLTFRPLSSEADYEACIALQRATWGDDFRDLVPPALLQVTQKVGGIAAGAFDGDRLVGFVYGLTGLEGGRPVHWSHMLAVDQAARDRGIGRRLKAYQRDRVAALGVERMYWTFDPLVARNAHLNLNVLGARVVEYVRAMYGDHPTSRTDSVIGSDRFVVAWDLGGPAGRRTGGPIESGNFGPSARRPAGPPISSESDPLPDAPSVLVAIPADIQALKPDDQAQALAWRQSTRRAFEHYLAKGYVVRELVPHPAGADSCYLVERPA
jgi:predicted GNAT superfamily acetyltransferase